MRADTGLSLVGYTQLFTFRAGGSALVTGREYGRGVELNCAQSLRWFLAMAQA
jgi:hypothetical protein